MLLEGLTPQDMLQLRRHSLQVPSRKLTYTDGCGTIKQHHVSLACMDLYQAAIDQTHYEIPAARLAKASIATLRESGRLIKLTLADYVANRCLITDMDSAMLRTIYMRLRRLAAHFSAPELLELLNGGNLPASAQQFAHA
ncbi:hypothetical protein [Paenibacillus whitsoniae]|uniref:Uncharacterized protein n=1 Tax=Paenibacillus whitsoniae TaxID=2496558 RepID=A0A3S0A6Z5_9BACL|nr:hypothetical protein [Paenibacillus whitsoniae]RTE02854.1 hypothetical protein EJQ19_28785 [Paenibacillus whitsoniae]